jgi:hypothetical protein
MSPDLESRMTEAVEQMRSRSWYDNVIANRWGAIQQTVDEFVRIALIQVLE